MKFISASILLSSVLVVTKNVRASGHLRGRELETTYDWSQLGGNIQAGTTDYRDSDFHVAISGDGDTTAVGSPVVDNARGKVVVTRLNYFSGEWESIGSDIVGNEEGAYAGVSVALNQQGNILAVGFPGCLDADDWFCRGSSFARVYKLDDSSKEWAQLGSDIFKADSDTSWQSGFSVDLDLEGTTVAVSAPGYRILGCCTPGQVRVYTFDQGSDDWESLGQPLQGPLNSTQAYLFGFSLSLSGDASTLAAGSPRHSGATGLAQVFHMNNDAAEWQSLGNIIYGEAGGAQAGSAIDLSEDGTVLAVGQGEYRPPGSGFYDTGLVRIYNLDLEQDSWIQKGADILPDEDSWNGWAAFGDGRSLSLSSDGNTIAVAAPGLSFNGVIMGLVRVFRFVGTDWSKVGSTIPGEKRYGLNTESGTGFVSLSSDGGRVAVGAPLHQMCDGVLDFNCNSAPRDNMNWTGYVRTFELTADETISPTSAPTTLSPTSAPTTSAPTNSPTTNPTAPVPVPTQLFTSLATTFSLSPTLSPSEEGTILGSSVGGRRTGLAYSPFLALFGCMLLL
jgi:hypothetical protein